MTAFEIFLYALALLTVLWVRAGAPLPTEPAAPAEVAPTPAPPVPAMPATVSAPVAIARVEDAWIAELEVEPPSPTAAADYLATWSAQELRKECSRRAIAWRNAHGKGKHLLKDEMLRALA